jgi:hypothetical protein
MNTLQWVALGAASWLGVIALTWAFVHGATLLRHPGRDRSVS